MSYYVPRLLDLYAEDALSGFDDNLFAKLLLAVRPEIAGKRLVPNVGELMSDEERFSIFAFVQIVLRTQLEEDVAEDRAWIMTETVSFLAAFDTPIGPFLNTLQNSNSSAVRANVCVFMAKHFWQPSGFGNIWLDDYSMLPENAWTLSALFTPKSVATYLLEHIEDVQRFGPKPREEVGYAFDLAMSRQTL